MEIKKESITFEGVELFPLPMRTALRYFQLIDFNIYLTSDEKKFFKIRHDVKIIQEVIEKYRDKGIKEIYVEEPDYMNFLAKIRQGLAQKLFDPSTIEDSDNKAVATLNEAYLMLKNALSNFGLTQGTLELAEEINKASMQTLKLCPNIFMLYKRYKNECQEGFLDGLLTGFMTTILVEGVSWRTKPIVEKLSLASLLLDLNLNKKEYTEMKAAMGQEVGLSEKVRVHPIEMSKLLSKFKDSFPKEVLDCVEFHHEMPDGSGYPKAVDYQRISKLPACLICAQYFSFLIRKNEFDFQKKDIIIEELNSKFNYPNFSEFLEIMIDILT